MVANFNTRYRIVDRLGFGGMGVVYRAEDLTLHRPVALKFLRPEITADQQARARFLREARIAAALNHPNTCTVYEVSEVDWPSDSTDREDAIGPGTPFIAMEFIEGETLADRLAKPWRPSFDEVLDAAIQVAEGLAEAHNQRIVHRDLKPHNVMITRRGRVKILDFGLAKPLDSERGPGETLTTSEVISADLGHISIVGTCGYMSPEQALGRAVDQRSDVFAFGIMLYEMVAGHRPFRADTARAVLAKIIEAEPEPLASASAKVSPELERIIRRCLRKRPEARYNDTRDLVVDLSELRARRRRGATPASAASLAVLPLINLSGEPADDFLADGMTDELISRLMKIRALRVSSRTSVMAYKAVNKPMRQIAEELGVDWIVEGAVLRSGPRIRITARVIDGRTEEHLWAERYEHDMRDVLRLQSEVAVEIAHQVQVTMTAPERDRLTNARPIDPEAYEAYLRGRFFWNKRTRDELKRAVHYFALAIERDPTYAPAHAGLGDSYALLSTTGYDALPPREAMPLAKRAAQDALRLDDTLAQAHASLAYVLLSYDWDWQNAGEEFARALDLDPAYATAHNWYGHCLFAQGRLNDAMEQMERARQLDPLSVPCNMGVGWALYYARKYDEAITQYRKTLEIAPDLPMVLYELGLAYQQKGLLDEARAVFEKAHSLSGGEPAAVMLLGQFHGLLGREKEARQELAKLEGIAKQRYVPALYTAFVHAGMSDNDAAFLWLEKAYEERTNYLIYLAVEPSLDKLRSDPRYPALVRRIGI